MRLIALALLCIGLTACVVAPEPPAATSQKQEKNTELRDAIQAPIEKANKVEDQVLEGAEQQANQIEDAGG
jgi:hypothetical protein